mgnify:CR=1 FL=1
MSPLALLAAGRAVEARIVHPTGILGTELRARGVAKTKRTGCSHAIQPGSEERNSGIGWLAKTKSSLITHDISSNRKPVSSRC